MRRNIDGSCSGDPCCKPRNIRTINTMNPDDSGNFTIHGTQGIHVTVGTNEIIISGVAVYYDNLDGNLVIDNDAMTIDFADDIVIAGDLTVNGTYYTVHAEHVYTQDDYIIMRDGALAALGSGQYSGFQVKKYDGTNDGRLVIDNTGTARVGDVGDEQPLLTREESANLNNGALLKWDAANSKAIDEGTVGSDTKPIKIVNGVATPVQTDLLPNSTPRVSDYYEIKYPYDITSMGSYQYPYVIRVIDTNNIVLGNIRLTLRTDGGTELYITVRNADGTYKDVILAAGNP